MALKRAISYHELASKKFKTMELEGEFKDLIGTPELTSAWIVYGPSGNGKTRFCLQLAKELSRFKKVGYNTIEEGVKLTFQRAIIESNIKAVASKFIIIPGDNLTDLKERLKRPKSPDIIFIDSIQYFNKLTSTNKTIGITYMDYKTLIQDFPKKLFIIISHSDGNKPKGSLAQSIEYDADVKIKIEGYKAFALSRYGGNQPYTIWQEGAQQYWNEL